MADTTRRWTLLKADLLGRVECGHSSAGEAVSEASPEDSGTPDRVRRSTDAAAWWMRSIARRLAGREARALAHLESLEGVPELCSWDGHELQRGWLDGEPLQVARVTEPAYYAAARRLLVQLHRRSVTHNDLAKEPNLLVRSDGRPALIDFQLARVHRRRSRWFRLCAREDLRHLLKHKRSYCPDALTPRERAILARPSMPARIWRVTGKKLYLLITRGLLGWADREGAGDRGAA